MTEQFSRPGAIDLSALKTAAESPAATPGASWVTDVTEASFDDVAQRSLNHPVVLELWSLRARGADQLAADLASLTNEAAGAWLLGRVDVDANPRIAQALQAQAVPTVVAILGGQVVPLFQGTQPKAQIKALLDQLMQVAVANGMVGKAAPVAQGDPTEAPASDPRFAAADEALSRGDYSAAVAEFDKLLVATPHDQEVITGRAHAALLQRAHSDVAATADAVEAALLAADADVVAGQPASAFDRLLEVIRETSGAERERARVRLLELFAIVGHTDPAVLKARRDLSTALFWVDSPLLR